MSVQLGGDDAVIEVWVRVRPAVDGTYVAVVDLGDDVTIELDRHSAAQWAYAVLEQTQRAEYAAAALAQVTELADYYVANQVLGRAGAEWPPPSGWCRPLELVPEISRSGEPFLSVNIGGDHVGRWSIVEARVHAVAVLESVIVADLNAGYRRALVGVLGIGDDAAWSIVATLPAQVIGDANVRWGA